jgi:hypothetical protein
MTRAVSRTMEESMELRIAETDVPERDIEVGLSVSGIARPSRAESVDAARTLVLPSAMTRAMQRGATQPRTAAVGA